jgi:hypothetical protein
MADEELFKGAYLGMSDRKGSKLHNGDTVTFNWKGERVKCVIVYHEGMFCLKWPDGYINKGSLNPSNYTKENI